MNELDDVVYRIHCLPASSRMSECMMWVNPTALGLTRSSEVRVNPNRYRLAVVCCARVCAAAAIECESERCAVRYGAVRGACLPQVASRGSRVCRMRDDEDSKLQSRKLCVITFFIIYKIVL